MCFRRDDAVTGDVARLFFRSVAAGDKIELRVVNNRLDLLQYSGGVLTSLGAYWMTVQTGVWYDVAVLAEGQHFDVWLRTPGAADYTKIITTNAAVILHSTSQWFNVFANHQVSFDNITFAPLPEMARVTVSGDSTATAVLSPLDLVGDLDATLDYFQSDAYFAAYPEIFPPAEMDAALYDNNFYESGSGFGTFEGNGILDAAELYLLEYLLRTPGAALHGNAAAQAHIGGATPYTMLEREASRGGRARRSSQAVDCCARVAECGNIVGRRYWICP